MNGVKVLWIGVNQVCKVNRFYKISQHKVPNFSNLERHRIL